MYISASLAYMSSPLGVEYGHGEWQARLTTDAYLLPSVYCRLHMSRQTCNHVCMSFIHCVPNEQIKDECVCTYPCDVHEHGVGYGRRILQAGLSLLHRHERNARRQRARVGISLGVDRRRSWAARQLCACVEGWDPVWGYVIRLRDVHVRERSRVEVN
eukprot:352805-Chlamydomonas_euryale.AAC.2